VVLKGGKGGVSKDRAQPRRLSQIPFAEGEMLIEPGKSSRLACRCLFPMDPGGPGMRGMNFNGGEKSQTSSKLKEKRMKTRTKQHKVFQTLTALGIAP